MLQASKRTRTSRSLQASFAELGFDFVHGELRDTNDPLPRIPPSRFIGGLRYQKNAFQAGGEIVAASKQDRVFGAETTTDELRC